MKVGKRTVKRIFRNQDSLRNLYFVAGFVAALFAGHGIAIVSNVTMVVNGFVLSQTINRAAFLVFGIMLLLIIHLIKTHGVRK